MVVSPGGGSPLASLIEPLTPLFPPGIKRLVVVVTLLSQIHGHRRSEAFRAKLAHSFGA